MAWLACARIFARFKTLKLLHIKIHMRQRPVAIMLLLAFLVPWQAAAQNRQDAAKAALREPQIRALLDDNASKRLEAMNALRKNPGEARNLLVAALQSDRPPSNRWRLVHRLGEFGRLSDLPLLEAIRRAPQDEFEGRIAMGAIRGLYTPHAAPAELRRAVEGFAFVQSGAARRTGKGDEGWSLTQWSIERLHAEGLPPTVLQKLQGLHNRVYDTREDLDDKIKQALGRKTHKEHGALVLAGAEQTHPQVSLSGRVRIRLANPFDKPLALELSLGIWGGHLSAAQAPIQVVLNPGERTTHNEDITVLTDTATPTLRFDLRMRELEGPDVTTYQKILLPLQR